MLDTIFASALSGLRAAMGRVGVAANNVANINNVSRLQPQPGDPPAYQPLEAVQSPVPGGGVTSRPFPVTPASIPVFSPDSHLANADGLVAVPNIDLAQQLVDLAMAEIAFKANLRTIEAGQQMQEKLLNLKT